MSSAVSSMVDPVCFQASKEFIMNCLLPTLKEIDSKKLKCPKLSVPFLRLSFPGNKGSPSFDENKSALRLSASEVVDVNVISGRKLTFDDRVKKVLSVTLQFKDQKIPFEPGDSFGFLCRNPDSEITLLLKRLGLQSFSELPCEIVAIGNGKVPPHLPTHSMLSHILTHCVDLRTVPKKAFLRVLAHYTKVEEEKQALIFLSSHEGSAFYDDLIRKPSLSILDVLLTFKSCSIMIKRLLEYLPPLKPRFYSVASSPLVSSDSFDIVFSVVEIQPEGGRCLARKGICTGWLEKMTEKLVDESSSDEAIPDLSELSLHDRHRPQTICVYKRRNDFFRLPDRVSVPMILVGPGTGVSPFVGFLQQREVQAKSCSGEEFGETWLFYGCRHKDSDFLFRSELERLNSCGALSHLIVCFSRDDPDSPQPRRVQDNIVTHSRSLLSLIDSGAVVYVCGDATNMVKDVREAFAKVFQSSRGCTKGEAESMLKNLESENRYRVDTWV